MGIASVSIASGLLGLIPPLRSITSLLWPSAPACEDSTVGSFTTERFYDTTPTSIYHGHSGPEHQHAKQRKPCPTSAVLTCRRQTAPLKVRTQVELLENKAFVRRMVISGRMSDVCAELDRMADRESH